MTDRTPPDYPRRFTLPNAFVILLHARHYTVHDSTTAHAVTAHQLIGPDPIHMRDLTPICGTDAPVAVLLGTRPDHSAIPMGWPPRAATLTKHGLTRCPDCMNAQPARRPHPDWTAT